MDEICHFNDVAIFYLGISHIKCSNCSNSVLIQRLCVSPQQDLQWNNMYDYDMPLYSAPI